MAKSCHNCAHVSCGRSHQFRETDCRFFKAKQKDTAKDIVNSMKEWPEWKQAVHKLAEPDRSDWPHCSRTSCNRNDRRRCEILTDNDFGGRECPFYRRRD